MKRNEAAWSSRLGSLWPEFSARSGSLSGPHLLALIYLTGAAIYAIFAFRNFSSGEVIATVFLFSALPLGLIFLSATPGGSESPLLGRQSIILAAAVAPVMFFIQFSGLTRWAPYFSNFANHRMGLGEPGFHQDSVFHVAIIQGVLNTGYPTTGQHEEPWASYHTLSHYVDAIALYFLGLDPWESYTLFFFAKGVAVSLAVIYFSTRVAEGRSESVFWLTLLIVYPAFTATWHVIGSHGQWLPMTILPLVAYRVFLIATKNHRTWSEYLLLSVLVIVFSFGKVSIGFAFAVLVGLWLFLRRPVDWRIVIVGVTWVSFLGVFSLVYSPGVSGDIDSSVLWGRFAFAWPDIFALILIAVVTGFVSQVVKAKFGWALTGAITASVIVTVGAVIVATDNPSDVFYFFHGLFSVALFLSVALVAEALLPNTIKNEASAGSQLHPIRILAFMGALLFAVSPIVSKAQVSPYANLDSMWTIATTVTNHTYFWSNEGAERGDRLTAWQALRGKPLRVENIYEQPWPLQFRDSLHEFIASQGISDGSPVLFLTAEQLELVSNKISPPTPWSTGLAITAVTGVPLLFGVLDPDFQNYGFRDYGDDAQVLSENQVSQARLCQFDRPVIVFVDVDQLTFSLLCAE